MVLLDLVNCRSGYSPTHFQRDLFPTELRHKIAVIFDGIETDVFRRRAERPPPGGRPDHRPLDPGRHLRESRLRVDARLRHLHEDGQAHLPSDIPDVVFVVVGSDRICYGGDEKHIRHKTFREHVLAQDDYDLSKFIFTGMVPTHTLVDLFSLSDLHIYLTVPFVLSWSLLDALACGCTVLASDTAPVREVIADGRNGLLADFFDVESLAEKAVAVLKDPPAYRHLGERSTSMVHERYALDVTLPKLIRWFERNLAGNLP